MAWLVSAVHVTFPSLSCLTVGLLHGDMAQGDRDKVIGDFKKKQFPILVATDVAGNHGSGVSDILLNFFWGVGECSSRAGHSLHQDCDQL